MKAINNFFRKISFISLFAVVVANITAAQDKSSTIKDIVESRQFIFHAQTALPASGASRQLTSEYDLKVSKNSVVSYLPFFGRAYSLPYGTNEGGFNFTSTKYDYSITERKKGGWEINIKPKDVVDFREFSLTVSENGYGTLQALTNNRQPISFTGYISSTK
jgi:hypothetical protein